MVFNQRWCPVVDGTQKAKWCLSSPTGLLQKTHGHSYSLQPKALFPMVPETSGSNTTHRVLLRVWIVLHGH